MSHSIDKPAALIADLDEGESLPANWYTDPAITAREIELVFRKSWNYIGPLSELTQVGDYITGLAGEIPVVVLRNENGLAGFINVCRHRRHIVMNGRGNAAMMQCRYHTWTYDLGGCLRRAPRSAAERDFRLEDYPLLPIRAEALGPFVFVNVDHNAPALASYFGKLMPIIAESGINLQTLKLHSREEWHSDANWKTMLENYLECYHCPVAHPGFSAAIDVLPENYHLTAHGWFLSQIGQARQSALEGKSAVKIYDVRGELSQVQYHLLWPNFTININPGFSNLSIDVWIPDGPNRTRGFSEQYFGPGVSHAFAEELIAFNRQVGEEDDALTNSVQRGLQGGLPAKGRFLTNSEHLIVHFQKLLVNVLTQTPAAAKQVVEAQASTPVGRVLPAIPDESRFPESERNTYFQLEVVRVERESDIIRSLYLRRADGKRLVPWEPGQFLPIRVPVPGEAQPVLRTYSISTCFNPDFYRLSIRRAESGLVSCFLNDNATHGLRIEALAPRGRFVLDQSSARPVVLLSGGVGITPMIAITEHIVAEGQRTGNFRPLYFIHGARNSLVHAFDQHVRQLAAQHPAMVTHVCYSRPAERDRVGVTHQADGQVTIDALKRILPLGDYDFYLCGPPPFMNSFYSGLIGVGVRPERIHYESFGPGTVLRPEVALTTDTATDKAATVRVRFAKSAVGAVWSRGNGTLMELAEAAGLAPAFGCRSGICGTCRTTLKHGAVDYLEEPLAPRAQNEILPCCSVPKRLARRQSDSSEPDLVLEL